ncbi:MAG: hypothetical protein IPP10_05465 [Candidatus Competibacteraceae bacterium]|nr:hypothetical protein [Candidatus Competibacteraceae bacterium]MBK8961754.1 hypothetical protein [Candidatus Competibacteraceae bacterium]MBK9950971.1 hypothetical protein [Candidatus Competibacteraceae bacterium]
MDGRNLYQDITATTESRIFNRLLDEVLHSRIQDRDGGSFTLFLLFVACRARAIFYFLLERFERYQEFFKEYINSGGVYCKSLGIAAVWWRLGGWGCNRAVA